MTDMHDEETVEQAYERVKRKPHWEWDDYDRDDIASWHMARMFEDREKRQARGELPPPPPPSPRPKRSLVQDLISIGCVYDPVAAAERRLITWPFERALFEIVHDMNSNVIRPPTNPKN